jgi:hypothetical protein
MELATLGGWCGLTSPGFGWWQQGFITKWIDFCRAAAKFRTFYGTKPPGPFLNRAYLL